MRAAILCPGPSLPRTWGDGDGFGGPVLAVNRAALRYPCDYWCADWKLAQSIDSVMGCPTLLTNRIGGEHLGLLWARRMYTDDLMPLCRDPPNWTLFSATAAMVLAAHLGATEIRCYGCDWTDEPDYDGVQVEGCQRDAARWRNELPIWRRLVEVLNGRGVSVERILPSG